jgi:aryl-alcohol dehydrogenase-like predicted oxidoreductase
MVNKLGFGGAAITSVGSLRKIMKLLNFAYDNGINHFDTAPLYGKGYSEIIFGKFIEDKREKITITTKFGYGDDNNSKEILLQPLLFANYWKKKGILKKKITNERPIYSGLNHRIIDKKEVELSFIRSLKNLKINYIDYFLLHEGIPSFLTDEAFQFLLDLKQNGDILKLGLATNISTLLNLQVSEVREWDVLQYEGFDCDKKQILKLRFSDKEHIHHSCIRNTNAINTIAQDINPSDLLAKAVLENIEGKVIFSSRDISRINNNINTVSKLTEL